jgi:hypothetical protein
MALAGSTNVWLSGPHNAGPKPENQMKQTKTPATTHTMMRAAMIKTVAAIAAEEMNVPTLAERKMDSLDFHNVGVWNIKAALEAAYMAGRNSKRTHAEVESLVRELTAFKTMQEMCDAVNYRPTIRITNADRAALADAYDDFQRSRGDDRRAFRQ